MTFGIKQKILVVLVTVVGLSAALNVLLASYFTNRQNEEAAFASLANDLLAWQSDLHDTTLQLRSIALATVTDAAILDQLSDLMTLASNLDGLARVSERREMSRTLAYRKTVTLNRLQLVLRTGGFSSIAVYSGGRLSHVVSAQDAGMSIRRADGSQAWITAPVDANGEIPFQAWPDWHEGPLPTADASALTAPRQPEVAFVFPEQGDAVMEIVVPVSGYVHELRTESRQAPVEHFFSGLAVSGAPDPAGEANAESDPGAPAATPDILATFVFRKLLGHAMLANVQQKTASLPAMFSPDGVHVQQLEGQPLIPEGMRKQAWLALPRQAAAILPRTVVLGPRSFYVAMLPWQFEGKPRLTLELAVPRDSTLRNIRQTVLAIVLGAGATMLLAVVVGLHWVKRFMDPIVDLTAAVKDIASLNRRDDRPRQQVLKRLQPVITGAPDEVGALARAFDDMVGELQRSFETLEQRVQARTAELRQQARYLRTLIDMLPMWAWFKDTGGRFLAVNEAAAHSRGLSPDELIGKTDHDVYPHELADAYRADDLEVMRTRRQGTAEEVYREPGKAIWLETFRAAVLDEDGTVLGTIGVARDISERKATEAARDAALVEAQRLAGMRSQFLAHMSHELRTPLNSILGFAQVLQRDKSLGARQARAVKIIADGGLHLLSLIDDVLDMARIDAAKLVLSPTEVDLAMLLEMVCDVVRVKAVEKNLSFAFETSGELPAALLADERRLRQVLLNLLSNAIKFTDKGKVALHVHAVAASQPPGQPAQRAEASVRLRFEVKDSGIGLTEAQQARLFQAFEQVTDAGRREGGSGLGLAISQQLVRLMGGNILVSSQPEQGSTFSFELVFQTAQPQVQAKHGIGAPIGYHGRRRRVLVADDSPQNRAMLVDALSTLGFEVLEAREGAEGLAMATAAIPDLVIVDAMMPVLDGFDTCRQIRQTPALAHVPILSASASPTPNVEARLRAAGADAFIPKPIEQEALLGALGQLLGLTWIHERSGGADGGDVDASLIYPPSDELQVLRELAAAGDMKSIRERAQYLMRLDVRFAPLAARLAVLAERYQSTAVTALLERGPQSTS